MFVQFLTGFSEPDRSGSGLYRVQQATAQPLLEVLDFSLCNVAFFGRHGHLARHAVLSAPTMSGERVCER